MFGYSWGPILIILLIVLILFGPRRLPELGESIGKAIKGFKKAHDEPLPPPEVTGNAQTGATAAPGACPQCHKDLGGEFGFCPHCGHRLKA